MSVTAINMVTTGSVDLLPNLIQIQTNDTLATVTAAGYLNGQMNIQYLVPGGLGAFNNNQLALVSTTDSLTTLLSVSVASTGTITLQTPAESGGSFSTISVGSGAAATPSINFTADTTTGLYRASAGTIGVSSAGTQVLSIGASTMSYLGGTLAAGASGTAGALASYPSTASKGALILQGVANTGNTNVTISNVAYGQASTISFADVGSAAGRFLVANTATPFTSGNLIKASGTGGLTVDAGFAVKSAITAAYAGGGTSNAFTATGLTASSIVTAVIVTSTNAVAIANAVPSSNTLTVTFTADPGANTTVAWIATSVAV